ncbi:MAG: SusD/RagB family nutrient-binding outer membrane lipoprotein [Bacteroidota bacterium]
MVKNWIYSALFLVILLTPACEKDFEEINTNPFLPTQTDIGPLFNSVIESLQLGWNEQFYLHNETLYGITQLASLTAATFQNVSIGTEEVWTNYYQSLANIRELERRFAAYEGDPEALNNVQAMLRIVLAYKTFRLTDLFGDMPFTEAGRGFESLELTRPAFDRQEDIYKFLLNELQIAEAQINLLPEPMTANGEPYLTYGAFDKLFNQDLLLWKKWANSLRLRHALRMSESDPEFAFGIIRDVLDNDLPLIEAGEDVVLIPDQLDWVNESVNWSFREHKKLRMGSNIWRQLSENDAPNGSGIFDPRAHIFFETNNEGAWVAFPQIPQNNTPPAGGIPYQRHRDINFEVKGSSNIYSPFNYYLIRDEDHIPEILMTAAEVNFIKAEIYMRGLGVAVDIGNAESEYAVGVVNSLTFWQNIFVNSEIWVNAPNPLTVSDFFNISNHPQINIFETSDKLAFIYRQRWLDAFRQPWEAFALGRRTGATPREGDMPEFYRFSYPASEAENNAENWSAQVAQMGEDSPRVRVWWMN